MHNGYMHGRRSSRVSACGSSPIMPTACLCSNLSMPMPRRVTECGSATLGPSDPYQHRRSGRAI